MVAPRYARASDLAEQLQAAGIAATHQASSLSAILPAVLIAPPAIDFSVGSYAGPLVTWSLHVVAATTDQDQAWPQLDGLVAEVAEHLVLGRADPTAYAVGDLTLPAYTLTFTEIVED